jgi:hypothetical protein
MSMELGRAPEWSSPQHGKSRLTMPKVQSGESPPALDLAYAVSGSEKEAGGTTNPLIQGWLNGCRSLIPHGH